MNSDLWLFIAHGHNTWTRADVPTGMKTARDLVTYLQRGGRIVSPWMDLPERAKFVPRVAGMTVIARLTD